VIGAGSAVAAASQPQERRNAKPDSSSMHGSGMITATSWSALFEDPMETEPAVVTSSLIW
jgi:hypothetical protein